MTSIVYDLLHEFMQGSSGASYSYDCRIRLKPTALDAVWIAFRVMFRCFPSVAQSYLVALLVLSD